MRIALGLLGALLVAATPAKSADDPLLRPIASEHAKQWLMPQPPTRIYGNTYLVGFGGLNVGLIKTRAGLILIDGAVPQAVHDIEANIRTLGFRLKDVKLILSTEPHFDHAGGLAALSRDTGATVLSSAPAAIVLRQGRSNADDPQMAWLEPYPPVTRLRTVRDGEAIRLGGVTVTAHATPGHTPGSMSWGWRSCEGKTCRSVLFGSSLNPLTAGDYRFSDPAHAVALANFRRTIATVRRLPCDILITAHPGQSGGDVKFAKLLQSRDPNPFVDPEACRTYADAAATALDKQIAKEKSGAPS
ncbi:subclass B3 metallo-beta-lactamase [Sphingomonas oryzagri]|uniref:Subclass B3 metallo-beta-lactamase n=1 Tax=Sphingomonas oryzagri TaxID=3042314 RepID=A0ABT6N6G7_9SPHN|nr:subclass B3 metallo-beta-lactamase [Sphingomonas oryzagri]MDH7640708.1 subclass B3 metallo-beta-lactamase [Sphingomonas oryzagri]